MARQRQLRSLKLMDLTPAYCSACGGWHLSAPSADPLEPIPEAVQRKGSRSRAAKALPAASLAALARPGHRAAVKWTNTHRPTIAATLTEPIRSCVLVVHPDRRARRSMVKALTTRGFATFEAADFNEALNVWMCQRCELLVTAVDMPGGTGTELLQRLTLRGVRGIAVGSGVDAVSDWSLSAAGFLARLSDPSDADALHTAIASTASSN
jgi:CheY-like chemotaxis protein